ncbi:hypothetical protein [Hymenobacter glacieicola]|uniref:DUF1795 domain-containing protein n=1 Tax=Hymenobacter glacieicola TaxID=1562124 RepID=A0ABQ1WIT4_9BACT|nr:hypothetical protein [Hymenobacter glacieicola]GGG32029.1 hypothetical protein GCM10011378_05700 [Hymenobacter glacieicola]
MKKLSTITVYLLALFFFSAAITGIELEEKMLIDKKVSLKIPKGFEVMQEQMLKVKYPSERRPTIVYTNSTGGINVALNLTINQASQELIPAYQENLRQTFAKLYPSAKGVRSGVEEVNGRKVAFIELVTPAIDSEIYNLIFLTDVDGKLLLCTFNCMVKDQVAWQPTAREIMASLKVTKL